MSLQMPPGVTAVMLSELTLEQQVGMIFDIANFNFEGNVQSNLAVAVLKDYTLNKPGALRLREASKAVRRVLESL